MQYMLILYTYDANNILVENIKSRKLFRNFTSIWCHVQKLEAVGDAPNLNIMDDEVSRAIKR